MTLKLLLTGIIVAGLGVFGGYSYYMSKTNQPAPSEEMASDDALDVSNIQSVANDTSDASRISRSEAFTNFAGEKTGTKYRYLADTVAKMRADIAAAEAQGITMQLLQQKAIFSKNLASLAFLSSDMDKATYSATIREAYNVLFDGLKSMQETAQKEGRNPRYLRRFHVYTIASIYRTANDPELLLESKFGSDANLRELAKQYSGNLDVAGTRYIFEVIASRNDLPRDNFMVADRLFHYARLLGYDDVRGDSNLSPVIYNEISNLEKMFSTASSTLLTESSVENTIRPIAQFANGLALATRASSSLVPTIDAIIMLKKSVDLIDNKAQSDQDALYFTKFVCQINYAALLYEAEKSITPEISKILAEIESIAARYAENPQMTASYRRYLQMANDPRGSWNVNLTTLLKIANEDLKLKEFLTRSGVKI